MIRAGLIEETGATESTGKDGVCSVLVALLMSRGAVALRTEDKEESAEEDRCDSWTAFLMKGKMAFATSGGSDDNGVTT